MKLKKKNVAKLIIVIALTVSLVFGYKTYKKNYEICSYKWVKEEKSSIGQYRLYINDKKGKHVDGKIMITYLNGKSKYEEISKDGKLYVKSVIKKVSNPKRRKK